MDMEVGLGPDHIVLDGEPAPQRGTAPIFDPYLLWPNGCMDQDTTWYGGRPRPWRHCIIWGPSSPPAERGTLRIWASVIFLLPVSAYALVGRLLSPFLQSLAPHIPFLDHYGPI